MSKVERDTALMTEYSQSVMKPADFVFDHSKCLNKGGSVRKITVAMRDPTGQPLAWVISEVFSDDVCDEVIALGDKAGYHSGKNPLRTGKRTTNYQNEDLAKKAFKLLPDELFPELEALDGHKVLGVHPNWRLVRYQEGEGFPPHRDQSDISPQMRKDGGKDFVYSSHTLLINTTKGDLEGGETRFFPHCKRGSDAAYGNSVDIRLPRGWALVFRQRHLIHCGQPVLSGSKHVAQAGILRLLPPSERFIQCGFRWGPGFAARSGPGTSTAYDAMIRDGKSPFGNETAYGQYLCENIMRLIMGAIGSNNDALYGTIWSFCFTQKRIAAN